MFWDFCTSIARLTKQPKLVLDISSKSVPFVPSRGDASKRDEKSFQSDLSIWKVFWHSPRLGTKGTDLLEMSGTRFGCLVGRAILKVPECMSEWTIHIGHMIFESVSKPSSKPPFTETMIWRSTALAHLQISSWRLPWTEPRYTCVSVCICLCWSSLGKAQSDWFVILQTRCTEAENKARQIQAKVAADLSVLSQELVEANSKIEVLQQVNISNWLYCIFQCVQCMHHVVHTFDLFNTYSHTHTQGPRKSRCGVSSSFDESAK